MFRMALPPIKFRLMKWQHPKNRLWDKWRYQGHCRNPHLKPRYSKTPWQSPNKCNLANLWDRFSMLPSWVLLSPRPNWSTSRIRTTESTEVSSFCSRSTWIQVPKPPICTSKHKRSFSTAPGSLWWTMLRQALNNWLIIRKIPTTTSCKSYRSICFPWKISWGIWSSTCRWIREPSFRFHFLAKLRQRDFAAKLWIPFTSFAARKSWRSKFLAESRRTLEFTLGKEQLSTSRCWRPLQWSSLSSLCWMCLYTWSTMRTQNHLLLVISTDFSVNFLWRVLENLAKGVDMQAWMWPNIVTRADV